MACVSERGSTTEAYARRGNDQHLSRTLCPNGWSGLFSHNGGLSGRSSIDSLAWRRDGQGAAQTTPSRTQPSRGPTARTLRPTSTASLTNPNGNPKPLLCPRGGPSPVSGAPCQSLATGLFACRSTPASKQCEVLAHSPWCKAPASESRRCARRCFRPHPSVRGLGTARLLRLSRLGRPRCCYATVPIVASTALVVTVGDHRTVCSPQPAAADRRPPARGAAPPRRANLAPPATPISLCCFSLGCGVVPGDDVRLRDGRQRCASPTTRGCRRKREQSLRAASLWMLAQEPDVDPARVPEATGTPIRRHRRRDRNRLDGVADQPSPSR